MKTQIDFNLDAIRRQRAEANAAFDRLYPEEPPAKEPRTFDAWVHSLAGREIAGLFIKLAWGLKRRGFKRYSARAIVHRIRWHHDLKHGPDSVNAGGYKIANHWSAYLARFAEAREPKLTDFFTSKQSEADKIDMSKTAETRKGDQ